MSMLPLPLAARTIREYSSFVADINLRDVMESPASRIRILDAGAGTKILSVLCPDSSTPILLTVKDDLVLDLQVSKILTTSTSVVRIQVMW